MFVWRLVDAFCTGSLDVLAILAWYGVYQLVVEKLPAAPQVGRFQFCVHQVHLTMAGRRPDSKLSSNSTGLYHWSLGPDASGSFDLEPKFDSFPAPIGSFNYKFS